jgi:hypothetical protein
MGYREEKGLNQYASIIHSEMVKPRGTEMATKKGTAMPQRAVRTIGENTAFPLLRRGLQMIYTGPLPVNPAHSA